MKKLKWGIIGLGKIAHKFAEDLLLSTGSQLYGVASRSLDKSESFAKKYGAVKHFGAYLELVKDPEIDVVYIATPHPFHEENTLMCLEHGKHVLCEKPMGMNKEQAEKMFGVAKEKNLFLMEALWSRFIPGIEKMLEIVRSDTLGKILFLRADFGFKAAFDPSGRVYNKKLGGGSLLDIGIYPIFLSQLLLGKPSGIKAMARMASTGVDTFCAMLLDFPGNEKAVLESTVEGDTPVEAYIYGEKGNIKLHSRFHHTQKITLSLDGQKPRTITAEYVGNGYYHEIKEVEKCIAEGKIQSKKFSEKDSLHLVETMDRVREEIGLHYDL